MRLGENKWLCRLVQYFGLGMVVVVLCFIFTHLGFLCTDPNSARYMLSAVVQSEAAIIAIVVTLSLVTVQLAASSYSVRFIDVFVDIKKNPDLVILIFIYGFAIFYGLCILKQIDGPTLRPTQTLHISIAYYLGIFTFISLIPYIRNTLNLLNPSTVIEILSRRITRLNKKEPENRYDKDSIQSITDIVRSSLMRYDYEAAQAGLQEIKNWNRIVEKETSDKTLEEILIPLFTHIRRAGKVATNRKMGDYVLLVTTILQVYGKIAAERSLGDAACWAVHSLRRVGKDTAEQGLELTPLHALISLEEIGKIAAERRLEDAAWWAAHSLGTIGKAVAKQKLEIVTMQAEISLELVGKNAAEKGPEDVTGQAVESLKKVKEVAEKQQLKNAIQKAVTSLEEVEKAALEQEFKNAEKYMENSLEMMSENIKRVIQLHFPE